MIMKIFSNNTIKLLMNYKKLKMTYNSLNYKLIHILLNMSRIPMTLRFYKKTMKGKLMTMRNSISNIMSRKWRLRNLKMNFKMFRMKLMSKRNKLRIWKWRNFSCKELLMNWKPPLYRVMIRKMHFKNIKHFIYKKLMNASL